MLLAAFNGARWIEEQIDSILFQRGVDVHILVSDDGSSDHTREILAQYAADRLTIAVRQTPTASAAQNFFAMIRETDAEGFHLVAFADQDDIWSTDRLSRAAHALCESDYAGYSSSTTAFWSANKKQLLRQSSVTTESDFLFEGAGQGCTYVLTSRLYEKAREFLIANEKITSPLHYHDWAIYVLARAWRLTWIFDAEPTVLYRQHRQNDTGAKFSLNGIAKRISQIRNGWYKKQLIGISRLAAIANPIDPIIAEWQSLICRSGRLQRRIGIARFCYRGGRRRVDDRTVLIVAGIMGWI